MAKKPTSPEEIQAYEERRRVEQRAEREKRLRERAQRGGLWSRRDFFGRLSWGGFGLVSLVVSLVGLLAFVRSAFPRVLFVPPSTFKAGFPGDYPVGEVSEKYRSDQRTWIVREPQGFYAIFAKCTHLGCTPLWSATESKYKCPCHGSGYYRTGYNSKARRRVRWIVSSCRWLMTANSSWIKVKSIRCSRELTRINSTRTAFCVSSGQWKGECKGKEIV